MATPGVQIQQKAQSAENKHKLVKVSVPQKCFHEVALFLTQNECPIMSQSIPTGYIPPGNPRENVFERANPGHPGNFFCLIPCPGAKNDGRIPGGGAKIFPNSKKLLFKLAKNPKKIKKTTRQYKFFICRI